jgi:radical SAM superfamily enzyme YgiQ (UPF0313 family)
VRILLVNPGIYDKNRNLIKQKKVWMPGLTLPTLAALTPADHEVRFVDEITDRVPIDQDWDLVGLSSMGTGIIRAWEIGDLFKSKKIPVVMGGIAASLGGYKQHMEHCDALVIGEAENVWADVLRDVEHDNLKPCYQGSPADLSDLPIPRYDLMDKKKIGFWLPIQTTRGCKNRCRFCSVTSFYKGTFRTRPFDQIVRDIQAVKDLGFAKITIIDDSIGSDLPYLKELCRHLMPLKIQWMSQCTLSVAQHEDVLDLMARSGCTMLSMGLESLNQDNLISIEKNFNRADRYMKEIRRIRSFGIDVSTEMMIGLDEDEDTVFELMYKFIMETRISAPRIFIVTPIPGTPLHDDWASEGRIYDHEYIHYNGASLVFYPKKMTADVLEERYWQMYRRLFTIPAIFKRFLGSRPTRGFLVNLFVLAGNFHYLKHIKRQIPPGIV